MGHVVWDEEQRIRRRVGFSGGFMRWMPRWLSAWVLEGAHPQCESGNQHIDPAQQRGDCGSESLCFHLAGRDVFYVFG